jgi:enediyne biosynthesis protein E4
MKKQKDFSINLESTLSELKEKEELFGPSSNQSTMFIDKTDQYGLSGVKATNFNLVDIDNDGYTDLVVLPDYYSQPLFYRFNIHHKKFELMDSPFAESVKASFLLFYDLNRDGILDAIVGVINQKTEIEQHPLRLFWGEYRHGKLYLKEDTKAIEMPAAPTSSVALIDYNLDGYLDLFVGNWLQKQNDTFIPHRDSLLVFNKNKFIDQTELLTGEMAMNADRMMFTHATPTYGAQVCDIDQNGFPDILTVSTNGYPNRLWMNRYKVRDRYRYFEDHGVTSLYAGDTEGNLTSQGGGRTFAVACADYNNDGMMDVFLGELTHSYDNDLKDKSSVLTGSTFKFPPTFVRTEYLYETGDVDWNQADKRAVWFDYNNDGLLDLLVENTGFPPHTRLILFKQHPDHSFENVAKEAGLDIVNPLATVIADLNHDGKWDIITAQSNLRDARISRRIYVFENQTQSKSVPLKFYLRGKKANFHGLNATVTIKVKTKKGIENRTQVVSYSYGGLPPQNEEGLLFALNEGEMLESVRVRWPYSESLNQDRAGLEKSYKIKQNFLKQSVNITLCEDGDYLIGRLSCK